MRVTVIAVITRYAWKAQRSATAPERIVAAVPQNIAWKMKKIYASASPSPPNAKPDVPIRPDALLPYIKP